MGICRRQIPECNRGNLRVMHPVSVVGLIVEKKRIASEIDWSN